MSKKAFIAVLLILVGFISLIIVNFANAQQALPTPPVPVFTLKMDNLDNNTVDFSVKNLPVPLSVSDQNLTLFYGLRFKDHDSTVWPNIYSSDTFQVSSSSENTTFSLFLFPYYSLIKGQVWDFQVQAIYGNHSVTYNPTVINLPKGMPNGAYEIVFDPKSSSDWSSTETINLTDGSVSGDASIGGPISAFAPPNPFSVTIDSPQQDQVCNSASASLNLTITENSACKILAVSYFLDDLPNENASVSGLWFWNDYYWLQHSFPINFTFSKELTKLSQGEHSIVVSVEYNDSIYENSSLIGIVYSAKTDFFVSFSSITQSQSPTSSPTEQPTIGLGSTLGPLKHDDLALFSLAIVAISVVAIVFVGLLVYIVRRGREKQ
ncbi:MAG TPA: hypothetical protein VMD05_10415 [Candidatus Nanoarchaeia archaeon]|nr:hypothetical protein [Candidatus Nanoarchaeia archaeon]